MRLVYQDGGSHPSFTSQAVAFASATEASQLSSRARRLGEVSRPDAIAAGPQTIRVGGNGQPLEAARSGARRLRADAIRAAKRGQQRGAQPSGKRRTPARSVRCTQRLFGNLFSRGLFSGGTGASQDPSADTAPTPPQRGAGLLPGAQPLTAA